MLACAEASFVTNFKNVFDNGIGKSTVGREEVEWNSRVRSPAVLTFCTLYEFSSSGIFIQQVSWEKNTKSLRNHATQNSAHFRKLVSSQTSWSTSQSQRTQPNLS